MMCDCVHLTPFALISHESKIKEMFERVVEL